MSEAYRIEERASDSPCAPLMKPPGFFADAKFKMLVRPCELRMLDWKRASPKSSRNNIYVGDVATFWEMKTKRIEL
jgi:hypothetical protein